MQKLIALISSGLLMALFSLGAVAHAQTGVSVEGSVATTPPEETVDIGVGAEADESTGSEDAVSMETSATASADAPSAFSIT